MPYITDNEGTRYEVVEDSPVLYMNTTEGVKHISFPPTGYILKKSSQSSGEKCIRVGYDLHECPCQKCIDLDIQRESITNAERDKKDFGKKLMEFMEYWVPLNDRDNKRMIKFLSSNGYL